MWQGLNESDLIIYLIDIKKYNKYEIVSNILKLSETQKKIILVFNKNDLIDKKTILPKIKELDKSIDIDSYFSISAKKKLGIDNLVKYLLKKTYKSEWLFKDKEITDKDDIFITNECTRNTLLSLLHKEIPYNIKVKTKFLNILEIKISK